MPKRFSVRVGRRSVVVPGLSGFLGGGRGPAPRVHPPSTGRRCGGFTLLELMVAIGIIAILISILVPVVIHARKAAVLNRTHRYLETIRLGLEAYKGDWGMYPPVVLKWTPPNPNDPSTNINNADGKPMLVYDGAHALYTALMLRGNARMSRTMNRQNATLAGGSRSYGPYLNVEQIQSIGEPPSLIPNGVNITSTDRTLLADAYGSPILYVPAYPVPLNYINTLPYDNGRTSATSAYLDDSAQLTNRFGTPPYYDFAVIPHQVPDPVTSPTATIPPFHYVSPTMGHNGLDEMGVLLGDWLGPPFFPQDRCIDTNPIPPGGPPEYPAVTGPYILWTAGPDGRFGLKSGTLKTDDICNFEFDRMFRE